jgi:hypothetical protein
MRIPTLLPLALALVALAPSAVSDQTPYCTAVPNSTGVGATIRWEGPFLPDQGTLVVRDLPARTFGIFLYGQQIERTPFGNGLDCIGGATWILARRGAVNGVAILDIGLHGEKEDVLWLEQGIGLPWNFQYMYRDPAAGGARFNLTDAIHVQFATAGT